MESGWSQCLGRDWREPGKAAFAQLSEKLVRTAPRRVLRVHFFIKAPFQQRLISFSRKTIWIAREQRSLQVLGSERMTKLQSYCWDKV